MSLSLFRRCLIISASLLAATGANAAEPMNLFDGTSLTGWEGQTGLWTVEDGAITGETKADAPLKANSFLIWRQGTVKNFTLTFAYRILSESAHSGVHGTLMSETIDESEKDFVPEGIVALQLHVGKPMKVQFKEIVLTPIE